MKLLMLAIGKRHDENLVAAIEEYSKRLNTFVTVSWRLLEPARGKQNTDETRRIETQALLAELRPDDNVILLDERGQLWRSEEVASYLEIQKQDAVKRLVIIIGGAYGVDDALRHRATVVWSLSPLTFPHQLVRLIVVEQLYRAASIARGLPYHHE